MKVEFCFDFRIKYIGKYALLLPIGENSFHGAVLFNHTSAAMIELLKSHSVEETVSLFAAQFGIPLGQADKDCKAVIATLENGGIGYGIQ